MAAILAMTFSCSGKALTEYLPRNEDEADIIALLIEYERARKSFDLQGYLNCLHEKGLYHHAGRVMISKQKLADLLPEFWDGLRGGKRLFFPMCRESINGNWLVGFRIVDPHIKISGNTADVETMYLNTVWRQMHYIPLIKENSVWRISRLDWETK